MQLKSACAYTNLSFIFVQNYNSTKVRSYHYASDDIFAAENKPILIAQVRKIVENEAPISKALLGKKIHIRMGNQPSRATNRCLPGDNLRHITSLPHRT
ncbi:MAG: DUF3320 domain-containing protein [Bacteroides thetaiotaomicron]